MCGSKEPLLDGVQIPSRLSAIYVGLYNGKTVFSFLSASVWYVLFCLRLLRLLFAVSLSHQIKTCTHVPAYCNIPTHKCIAQCSPAATGKCACPTHTSDGLLPNYFGHLFIKTTVIINR